MKRTLRRSVSASEVNSKRPDLKIHPLLPRPQATRPLSSNLKENRATVGCRPTLGHKMTAALAPILKQAATNVRKLDTKPAAAKPQPIATKKIPPYDYKARFNDLLERHKPLKANFDQIKLQLEETRDANESLHKERDHFQAQFHSLTDKLSTSDAREKELRDRCENAEQNVAELTFIRDELERRCSHLNQNLKATSDSLAETSQKLYDSQKLNIQYEKLISQLREDVDRLGEITQKLHWERRSLHNKLQDLKGNIRVVCRVRPALTVGKPVASLAFPDICTLEMERVEPGATKRLAKHDFKFDRVFGPTSSQEDVWEEVSCLVQSALDGYNVCIFAYGQTGSGKTYTMEGSADCPGVVPRTCSMIFDSVEQLGRSGWEYKVKASFLEIYNEHIYDLLDPSRDPRDLDIRMVDAKGSDVYVSNLSERQVSSDRELLRLAAKAQTNRQTAATASNERSSRSHSVARITLSGVHSAKSLSLSSRICLVDLAGSESAKNTQRLQETKNINKSLAGLTQVILALQQKQDHVPFRNSKLTRLLEPQLGGAAKALLVAAAAPYEDCTHESLSTFRFATQVGHCSTAAARRNLALAQPSVKEA